MSRSSFYHWISKGRPQDTPLSNSLGLAIKSQFLKSKKRYGSPKVTAQLNENGIQVSKSTVARVMKTAGLRSIVARKFKATTNSNHGLPVAENILDRNFTQDQLNKVWVSDITYIRVNKKWNYLTTILDLADRMVIAWCLSNSMEAEQTTIKAWDIAIQTRSIKSQLIFHSDRGVQYACKAFKARLKASQNVLQSMSRKGNCWDNAVAESFFKTIKTECINHHNFSSQSEAYHTIFEYIEGWYNTKRLHSSIGMISPLKKHFLIKTT